MRLASAFSTACLISGLVGVHALLNLDLHSLFHHPVPPRPEVLKCTCCEMLGMAKKNAPFGALAKGSRPVWGKGAGGDP